METIGFGFVIIDGCIRFFVAKLDQYSFFFFMYSLNNLLVLSLICETSIYITIKRLVAFKKIKYRLRLNQQ